MRLLRRRGLDDKAAKAKRISKENGKEFWEKPEVIFLKHKQGCYIFALRAGKGFTPWYVGKATKTLEQEAFTSHKRGDHYNKILRNGGIGTPVMLYAAQSGTKRKIPPKEISHMEKTLIEYAAHKNPKLSNVKSRSVPRWGIKGVIRSPKGTHSATSKVFKSMMKM